MPVSVLSKYDSVRKMSSFRFMYALFTPIPQRESVFLSRITSLMMEDRDYPITRS
jgi:hypothetical protein